MENNRSGQHFIGYSHEDDRMRLLRVARIEYSINVIFFVLVGSLRWHFLVQKKSKDGKLLTFQISRTKAKPNQNESLNQYNKQTNKQRIYLFCCCVENGDKHKRGWSAHHIHAYMIVRSFNASAICWSPLRLWYNYYIQSDKHRVKEKMMQLITHYLPPQRLLYLQ